MDIRTNCGYDIVASIPTDKTHELVIGHSPKRVAHYVCWDCENGDNYSNGGYCETYRQALAILAERINNRYDYLAREL